VIDLSRNASTRLTTNPGADDMPLWSPDGHQITFRAQRRGKWGVYRLPFPQSGEEAMVVTDQPSTLSPLGWSPDSQFLLFSAGAQFNPSSQKRLWLVPRSGDRQPFAYSQSTFNEVQGQISPDGRWAAYVSDASGRTEVYVRPFPRGDGQWQISVDGGIEPVWRGDGRELFFIAANQTLMAVTVDGGPMPEFAAPTRLFDTSMASGFVNTSYTRNQYAVTTDGQRFLVNEHPEGGATPPVTIVLNWPAILK
jgi:Tol biopolymer transport system component